MKNLKRVLSLGLASVMLLGMMVMGASAADFTDAEKIEHTEAVDTMVALNIIKGKGDGSSFDPKGDVTRAEMAKMIAVIMNGGVERKFGATSKFADVPATHWAVEFISYCAANNIIVGNGTDPATGKPNFSPNGNVTYTAAAKMALVALGYDPKENGFEGTDWAVNTNSIALEAGLYDGLASDLDPSSNMSRDDAAQMLYNALSATVEGGNTVQATVYTVKVKGTDTTKQGQIASISGEKYDSFFEAYTIAEALKGTGGEIEKDYEINRGTEEITESLGGKYMNLDDTAKGVMTKVKYDEDDKVYTTTVGGTEYPAKADFSALMGQNVKVLTNSKTNKVYGIAAVDSEAVFEGSVGDFTAIDNKTATDKKTVTLGGTKYNAADTVTVRVFNDPDTTVAYNDANAINNSGITGISNEWALKAIADKDGKVDTIVVTPVTAKKISNVTSKSITVAGSASKEIGKEIIGYAGIQKGDWAAVTEAKYSVSGKIELAEAEVMTDVAATAYRTLTTGVNQVRVDGQWLTVLDSGDFDTLKAMKKNTTYDLVLVNGYVVSQAVAEASSEPKDLLVLIEKATAVTGGLNSSIEARVYFVKDNSTSVIKLPSAAKDDAKIANGHLYAYTEKNGIYTLTAPEAEDVGSEKAITATGGVTTNNKIGSTLISEDAQVIVIYADEEYNASSKPSEVKIEVVDGKTARDWGLSSAFGANAASLAFATKVNGVDYVQFAFLNATNVKSLPGAGTSGKNYGYIVSDPYTTSDGVVYDLWNGTEVLEDVTDKADAANTLVKGDFITYSVGDNVIKSSKIDTTDTTKVKTGAILGWNLDDEVINFAKGVNVVDAFVIDDKTEVLFVDIEGKVGQAGDLNDLIAANEDPENDGVYIPNAMYTLNETDTDHIDLLIVDVQGDINGETADVTVDTRATVTLSALTATTNWDLVGVNGDNDGTLDTSIKVVPGTTITVTVKQKTTVAEGSDEDAKKLGCDVTDSAGTPNVLGSIANTTGAQPTGNQTITITITGDVTLKLADKTAG